MCNINFKNLTKKYKPRKAFSYVFASSTVKLPDDYDGEDEEDEEEDDSVVEYTCPHCGEEMTFEVDSFDFDEDYLCPNCHQPLFPETPDEEE